MVKIVKKRKILVDDNKIPLLMKASGRGRSSVYNALAFRTYGGKAEDIRNLALERYAGILVNETIKAK